MKDTEKKELVKKSLTDSLNDIVNGVMKQLDETKVESPVVTEPVQVEAPKTETIEKSNTTDESAELIKNLQNKIETLEKKFESVNKTDVDSNEQKRQEIQKSVVELVKSMGIDTNNVDLNFTIMEKKKSEVSADDESDKFQKDFDPKNLDTEFEKLSEEDKSEALTKYFKDFIKK